MQIEKRYLEVTTLSHFMIRANLQVSKVRSQSHSLKDEEFLEIHQDRFADIRIDHLL